MRRPLQWSAGIILLLTLTCYAFAGQAEDTHTHQYVGNTCSVCGWMKPGLYVDNELVMSWDEMVEYGYLTVREYQKNLYTMYEHGPEGPCLMLESNQGNFLMGTLVIDEGIEYIDGNSYQGFRNDTLKEVWLPRSIRALGSYLLWNNTSVTDVRLFCELEEIPEKAFVGSVIERINLPDSVKAIGGEAFKECKNLKSIELPQGLERIGYNAFSESGLTSLTLPDSVTHIESGAFAETGITALRMPAGLEEISGRDFFAYSDITFLDFSACEKLTALPFGLCYECRALENIVFPPHLQSFESIGGGAMGAPPSSTFNRAEKLKEIRLPEEFVSLNGVTFPGAERVVWPVGLIDGSGFTEGNVNQILYRGSENRWKMTATADQFPGAVVTFDYTGD